MSKIRIYELAKKLHKSNKEILDELVKIGVEGKTHSSTIEDAISARITKILTSPAPAKEVPVERPAKVVEKDLRQAAAKSVKPAAAPPKTEAARPAEKKVAPAAGKPQAAPSRKADEQRQQAGKETVKPPETEEQPEAARPAGPGETEEDIKLPDRFKRDIEAEKIEKFKAKPGLQRAFQAIRKIEPKKWHDVKGGKKGDRSRFGQRQETRGQVLSTMPRKKNLKLREGTTVKEFSELIGLKFSDVIKKFMELGYMPTINQPVDPDAALLVAESFGVKVELASVEEDTRVEEVHEDVSKLAPRAPVVTIMGHVDHGKTSLLDAIRETKVTETEAGGITQHIGAYKVNLKGKDIVFLDTPGHEAFTSMRARGAKVTDIVVLVVAADDGVMPQTIEAINHAKAANVPIVVAVNKIDKPEANQAKVKSELSEQGIISEEWGGQNIFVEVSAKQRIGIEHLLEMILLQAEMMELKANPEREARGTVVEAKLDRGRGPVATLLVQTGTLKVSDALLSGVHVGKVRALIDDSGKRIQEAGPSTPVEVIGFSEVPAAGDVFTVVEDEKRARQIALARFQKQRSLEIAKAKKLTLDELYTKIKEGQIKELNIIIKGDVQGSVEALKDAFENITHPEVKVKVIHTSVGGINESDVMLATASNAIIIGFNVRPETKASQTAEKEGVDIRLYNVIYEAIEDVKKALEGMLEPTLKEKVLGRAEVRQLFPVSRLGTIAGCYVVDGYISRVSDGIRVLRDNIVVYEGKINTLKRFKDDVKEVQTGYECGILVENFNDIKVGDILENFIIEKIAAKL
jgi:translation initiation factor IF-2